LIEIGAITFVTNKQAQSLCRWTSPLIREYVIQYCSVIGLSAAALFPSVPITKEKEVEYVILFKIVAVMVNTKMIMDDSSRKTQSVNPTEASLHAEWYRIIKGLLYHQLPSHSVSFEGRVGEGNVRQFDLAIKNGDTVLLELKVKANTENLLQKAINQVATYGDLTDAKVCYIVNLTNCEPSTNGFHLVPKLKNCEVKVVHIVYSHDWLQLQTIRTFEYEVYF